MFSATLKESFLLCSHPLDRMRKLKERCTGTHLVDPGQKSCIQDFEAHPQKGGGVPLVEDRSQLRVLLSSFRLCSKTITVQRPSLESFIFIMDAPFRSWMRAKKLGKIKDY